MLGFFIDVLHMTIAVILASVGLGYEREDDCDSVMFLPASYEYTVASDGSIAEYVTVSECETSVNYIALQAL
jgi:NADPH:quinone reductase-like Zn-dependent oxidoreductase